MTLVSNMENLIIIITEFIGLLNTLAPDFYVPILSCM